MSSRTPFSSSHHLRSVPGSTTKSATLCGRFSPQTNACVMNGLAFEALFDGDRRDELSVFELVDLAHAARDVEKSVGVEAPEIARADAAVSPLHGRRLLREAVVFAHRSGRVDDDLARAVVGVADGSIDLDSDAIEGLAHGAEANQRQTVERGDGGSLRLPVDLAHLDPQALEELGHVFG